ncbi:hypothetical protein BGAL_0003g00050 [Botrytis galanthina]|uniref:SprT-like domain-containing protein n=1 Tax=Botrytis galanthina TaxID=278940 RepID=A0A4S8RGG7_9HELO|nr:hypothetical protein BGAL_0003g00050 [Botrytis galanthina]
MVCKHEYFRESEEEALFKSKATRKFAVGRHKASHLATLLIRNADLRGSYMTDIQREGRDLRFAEEKYSVGIFAKKLAKYDLSSESYVNLVKGFTTHYITVYDKLLFFGYLLASNRMEYRVQRQQAETFMNEAVTIAAFGPDNRVQHTKVELYVEANPYNTLEEQIWAWLGALAHELLHVFLFIYGCRECSNLPEQAGPTGHGHAWQSTAYRIEIACERLLSNKVSFGRLTSLLHDVNNGMPMPEERYLRRWNMIGLEDIEQMPEVPESARKMDHDERAPPRKDEKLNPPRKDDKVERRDPPCKVNRGGNRVPPKSGKRGKEREKPEPPKSSERASPRKDDRGGRRDHPKRDERISPRKDERRDRGERRDNTRS